MITLKYSENSWHARLWDSTYNTTLPISMCKYFWTLLAAIILAIPAYPGHIINLFNFRKYNTPDIPAGWFAFHVPVILMFGLGSIREDQAFPGFLALYGRGMVWLIITLLIMTILVFIGLVINWIYKKIKEISSKEGKEKCKSPNPIIVGVKSFFGKYCPKIEWL